MKLSSRKKEEICRAHQEDEQLRRDQQLLHEPLLEQNRDLREAHEKSINEMEELKRFQGSTFDTISRRKLVEDRDTILELTGKIQDLQNETNFLKDSRDFQVSRCWISSQWTISRYQSTSVFPTLSRSWRSCKAVLLECRAAEKGRQAFGTRMVYRETFLQIHTASSSAPYPQELRQWNPSSEEPFQWISTAHHHMWWVKAKHLFRIRDASQDRQPVIQSLLAREDFQKKYGADQQRLQISDPHFDKLSTPATFACWKIRFKTEVCTCSQFPTEAMLWIKEVELVDSVGDLKSSWSVRGIQMPNFEVFAAKIASALNRIIHNTQFKRKVNLEEQKTKKRTVSFVEDRSLTWSMSTSGSLEPMIPSRIMPTYLQLFI